MIEIGKQEFEQHNLLKIEGEIDASSSIFLDEAIRDMISSDKNSLLIDLTNLNYISSAGLGVFMSYIEEVAHKQKKMILFGLNPKVFRVFQILGLHELLTIVDTKEDAEKQGI